MPGFDPHEIPGFITDYVRTAGAPMWTATRIGDLSNYQIEQGCRSFVIAPTITELRLLCCAERVKADLVATAEREMRHAADAAEVRR